MHCDAHTTLDIQHAIYLLSHTHTQTHTHTHTHTQRERERERERERYSDRRGQTVSVSALVGRYAMLCLLLITQLFITDAEFLTYSFELKCD